jgi:hypothetical protein
MWVDSRKRTDGLADDVVPEQSRHQEQVESVVVTNAVHDLFEVVVRVVRVVRVVIVYERITLLKNRMRECDAFGIYHQLLIRLKRTK